VEKNISPKVYVKSMNRKIVLQIAIPKLIFTESKYVYYETLVSFPGGKKPASFPYHHVNES